MRSILIKETTMKLAPISFILFTLIWFLAEASEQSHRGNTEKIKLPTCAERPLQFSNAKIEVPNGIDGLPRGVLIARKAHYFVTEKKSGNRILTEQDFVERKSSLICATVDHESKISMSMYGPVLLNLTGRSNIQDSSWQFQIIANPDRIGMWNQKVRLGNVLKNSGVQVKAFELQDNKYEVLVSRESEATTENLLIQFDVSTGLE